MTHYVCPYPDELLDKWDSVSNPIGDACGDCTQYDCEHNMNADPDMPMPPWPEEEELEKLKAAYEIRLVKMLGETGTKQEARDE